MLSKMLAAWCGFWIGVLATASLAVVLLSLGGCASSRPATSPSAEVAPTSTSAADSLASHPVAVLAALPPYLVPAPVGSSPRQRRQWQRAQVRNLARAGVLPAKVKNAAVATAPGAVSINRPAAPGATGPQATATDARKAGQRGGGGVATAPAATATGATVTNKGLPWWLWVVFGLGCCAVGWRLARGSWLH